MLKYAGFLVVICGLGWFTLPFTPVQSLAQANDQAIFADTINPLFENWSWDSTVGPVATPLHAGSASLSVSYQQPWAALSLRTSPALMGLDYTGVQFWAHGGPNGVTLSLNIQESDNDVQVTNVVLNVPANTWTWYSFTLAELGSPAMIARINWQESTGTPQGPFFLDDVVLVGSSVVPALSLSVDVAADRHPISPYIYGMNYPSEALAAELSLPVARWGGNNTSRYNWQTSVSNTGSDYFYENILYQRDPNRTLPNGSASDLFVEQNQRTGTDSIITLPGMGLVSRGDSPTDHPLFCGFKVSVYGPQQAVDPWDTDCGNGIATNGTPITTNNPADTSMVVQPSFIGAWIDHLKLSYGTAQNGGVRFYGIDNEPMLWDETHRDVHPQPTSYDELRDVGYAYGALVKQHDATAQTLGPQLFGWTAYLYSALDWSAGGSWWNNPLDRNAHGGLEFSAWYLQQMQAYEQQNGQRILDYFDLHYYPQANGVSLSPAGNAATQALRLRSTRSLWDPSYQDESWIDTQVRLLPRMHDWVNANYPGTKLAISEYNWGAHEHINGALAQADVLGIFGREGLDLATLWDPPMATQPAAFAFRMYLNYDGAGNTFGETHVQALSSDQAQVAIFAAERADGALTIMLINKTAAAIDVNMPVTNFTAQTVTGYTYNPTNLNSISPPTAALQAGAVVSQLPAQSINLFVLKPEAIVFSEAVSLPFVRK